MSKNTTYVMIAIILIIVFGSILGLFLYKKMPDININQTENQTNTSQIDQLKTDEEKKSSISMNLLMVLIFLLIAGGISAYLYSNKKGQLINNNIDTKSIKDILKQQIIRNYKVPTCYYNSEGDLNIHNERNLQFLNQRIHTIKATGAKFLLIEIFVVSNDHDSGIHTFEIPRSEGKDSVIGENYTVYHRTTIKNYIDEHLHRKKLPIFGYDDQKERMMHQLNELSDDQQEIIDLQKKNLMTSISGNKGKENEQLEMKLDQEMINKQMDHEQKLIELQQKNKKGK